MKKFFYSKLEKPPNRLFQMKKVDTITKVERIVFKDFFHLNDTISLKLPSILEDSQKINSNFFLCAISNGQDSLAMFLFFLYSSKAICFENLYCHHFWQSQNFFSNRSLFQLSYWVKIPYKVILSSTKNTTENGSRDWRRTTFSRLSHFEHYLKLSIGHTQSDMFEKNLSSLLRGTSPAGIRNLVFLPTKQVGLFFSMDQILFKLNKDKCFLPLVMTKKAYLKSPLRFFQFGTPASQCFFYFQQFAIWRIKPSSYSVSLNFFNFGNTRLEGSILNYQETKNIFKRQILFSNRSLLLKKTTSCSFCFSSEFYKRNIVFSKPLKNLSRFNISQMLKLYYLPFLIDSTNFSLFFSRNKIRHQLVPFLRSVVQQDVEKVLIRFFELIEQEQKENLPKIRNFFFLLRILTTEGLKNKFSSLDSFSQFFSSRKNVGIQIFFKRHLQQLLIKLVQHLFYYYKNRSLTYLQLVKFQKFLNQREK